MANIYLNKLDKYMEEVKKRFDTGKAKKSNPLQYKQWQSKAVQVQQLRNEQAAKPGRVLIAAIKTIEKERIRMYNADIIPKVSYTYSTTSLIDRLKAKKM